MIDWNIRTASQWCGNISIAVNNYNKIWMITSFSISPGLSLFSLHCEGDCARKGNNTIYNTLTVSQTAVSGLGSAVVAAPIFFNSSLIAQHCWRWRFSCWLGATQEGRVCSLCSVCSLCEAAGGMIEKSHTSSLWNISSKLLSVQSTGRSSVSYVRISFLFICENSKNDQFNHK